MSLGTDETRTIRACPECGDSHITQRMSYPWDYDHQWRCAICETEFNEPLERQTGDASPPASESEPEPSAQRAVADGGVTEDVGGDSR